MPKMHTDVNRASQLKDLATTIQRIRTRLGMTTGEFADVLGVNQSTVSRYESGERVPRHRVIVELLTVANIDERQAMIGTLLGVGLIGASPGLAPTEIADAMVSMRGKTRAADALMDVLVEQNKQGDPGFRAFVVGVADVMDGCDTVPGSISSILQLWAAHHALNPNAPAYFRDALGYLKARLWGDQEAARQRATGGTPPSEGGDKTA